MICLTVCEKCSSRHTTVIYKGGDEVFCPVGLFLTHRSGQKIPIGEKLTRISDVPERCFYFLEQVVGGGGEDDRTVD